MDAAVRRLRSSALIGPERQSEASDLGTLQILAAVEAVLLSQQRLEGALDSIVAGQRAIARSLQAGENLTAGPVAAPALRKEAPSPEAEGKDEDSTTKYDEAPCRASALAGMERSSSKQLRFKRAPSVVHVPEHTAVARCHGTITLLSPSEAKTYLDATPSTLFLDVSSSSDPLLPGTYRVPFEDLIFQCRDDPVLAHRGLDEPVLVTCGLGSLARLASRILLDSGFTNVMTLDSDDMSWKACLSCRYLPANWPESVQQRPWYREDFQELDVDLVLSAPKASLKGAILGLAAGVIGSPSPSALTTSETRSETMVEHRWHCVLAPSSVPRIALDLLSLLFLMFDLVTVPWYLAWDQERTGWGNVGGLLSMLFWTADLAINFRTGFFLHGNLCMKPGTIARNYLTSWFFPDFFVVATDWASQVLLVSGGGAPTFSILRFAKWGRLLKFLAMMRLLRFSKVFARILDFTYKSPRLILVMQVAHLLFVVLYLNHFAACLWWLVGRTGATNTGYRWVDTEVDEAGYSFSSADLYYQYTTSLYCAMSQILTGSMPVTPTNSMEQMFCVACIVSGVLFLSTLVSTLSAKLMQLHMLQQERKAKLVELQEFLRRKAVCGDLGIHIMKQVGQSLAHRGPKTMQCLLAWDVLSRRNRTKLHRELCRPKLLKHRFFLMVGHINDSLLLQLCDRAVQVVVHNNEEVIFMPGTPASSAYLLVDGELNYTQEPETSMVPLRSERRIQPGEWVCEAALWTQWMHVGILEATAAVELMVVKAQEVGELFQHHPTVQHVACEYSRAFHAAVEAARPPFAAWPSDVEVPFGDFQEVVISMGKPARAFVSLLALQQRLTHHSVSSTQQRLESEVRRGRCTMVTSMEGEVELLACSVLLHLKRHDGKILVQVGTWEGTAAQPCCRLPGTRLLCGERPSAGFQRLLETQLACLREFVDLEECRSDVQTRTEAGIVTRTTTVTHFAELDECPDLPQASTPKSRVRRLPAGQLPRWSPRSPTALTPTATPPSFSTEEVLVVAGTADAAEEGEPWQEDGLELRLMAWLEEPLFERLAGDQGLEELRSFMVAVHVTAAAAQEARDLHHRCPRTPKGRARNESWDEASEEASNSPPSQQPQAGSPSSTQPEDPQAPPTDLEEVPDSPERPRMAHL